MTQIYMRVMICEPELQAYTKEFLGRSVEHCIEQIHEYLDTTTEPGTKCSVTFCGYKHGEKDEVTQ